MNRKIAKLLSLLLTVMLILSLFYGCGKKKSTEGISQEGVTKGASTEKSSSDDGLTEKNIKLTFWHNYGDAEEKQLKEVVLPMWKKLHPNITIEAVRQSNQYSQTIVTSFGTGKSPDVARIDATDTASFANLGGIVAMDDFKDFKELKDTFISGPLSTNRYKGKYYGLPLDTNCKAAVVNLKVMKKIGLTKAPATMEEFLEAAKKSKKPLLSVSGVGDWDFYLYVWLLGGSIANEEFTKASGYMDSQATIDAVTKLVELKKDGLLAIKDVDGSVDPWDGIKTGEYAMFFEGPWYFGSYDKNSSIVPAVIPTYNGKSASIVGGENIVVFETSKYKKEAYAFAKFMDSEDVQLAMLKVGQLPVLKSLINNSVVTENPVWSVYMKQLETASSRIPSPNKKDIEDTWSNTMKNIFVNGADVKKELKKAAAAIDKYMAK